MSGTSQQKDAEGERQTKTVQNVESTDPDAIPSEQRDSRRDLVSSPENIEFASVAGITKPKEEVVLSGTNVAFGQDTPVRQLPPSSPSMNVGLTTSSMTQPHHHPESKIEPPSPLKQDSELTITTPTISDEKLENPQAAMVASLKATKEQLGYVRATTDEEQQKQQPPANKRELKCKTCKLCKDERVPVAIIQPMEGNKSVAIKLSPQCGHACTIVITSTFEITEHVCTSYVEREEYEGGFSDFDFDRFISGGEDLDEFLLKQKSRQAGKLVTLEDQMKVAVKKLVKPLAILVPTAVEKKSEAQLRAEREDRLRQIVEIEANMVYLRVLEFEKAATGNIAYQIDKLSKMLKDLDKKYITGFIQKVNNEFLISYNEQTQAVRFYNPSKPEIEILSREFEKWLRFNRL